MSMYHEQRITIPCFKEYEITDLGNVYKKGTYELIEPQIIKGISAYKNKKRLLLIACENGIFYYITAHSITGVKTNPVRLSIDENTTYRATITLKWIEHIKYFDKSKEGIKEAINWAEKLEKFYY